MLASHNARRSTGLAATGFTILELLVVMGIIAVLFTLLLATIGRIYDRAKIITCASNERQLYLASMSYVNDNDNSLPCPSLIGETPTSTNGPQVSWAMDAISVADFQVGTLWPYMPPSLPTRQQVLMCPSDTSGFARLGTPVAASRNFSYSFNVNIRPGDGLVTLKLRQIVQPTKRVMVYEEFAPNDGACFGPTDSDDWLTGRHGGTNSTSVDTLSNYQDAAYLQIGRGNVCYFDGHIELMTVGFYFTAPYTHFTPLTQ